MKKYKVHVYFVQYSYGEKIIEAENAIAASEIAEEFNCEDFELTPEEGDLEIDYIEEI